MNHQVICEDFKLQKMTLMLKFMEILKVQHQTIHLLLPKVPEKKHLYVKEPNLNKNYLHQITSLSNNNQISIIRNQMRVFKSQYQSQIVRHRKSQKKMLKRIFLN